MAYAEFCQRTAGRFIHHVPNEGIDTVSASATWRSTFDAIEAAGFEIDPEFWPPRNATKCTQCHQGCHDSNVN